MEKFRDTIAFFNTLLSLSLGSPWMNIRHLSLSLAKMGFDHLVHPLLCGPVEQFPFVPLIRIRLIAFLF